MKVHSYCFVYTYLEYEIANQMTIEKERIKEKVLFILYRKAKKKGSVCGASKSCKFCRVMDAFFFKFTNSLYILYNFENKVISSKFIVYKNKLNY